jgi:hypothetical protein
MIFEFPTMEKADAFVREVERRFGLAGLLPHPPVGKFDCPLHFSE